MRCVFRSWRALAIVVGLAVWWSPTALLGAPDLGDPEVKILDKTKVYYPAIIKKGARFKKPAVLATATVFDSIKEWQEIKRKKLTETDAEYHILLAAANKAFQRAVAKVRTAGAYDIIAEVGAIECKNCTAEDVTQKAIEALPSSD